MSISLTQCPIEHLPSLSFVRTELGEGSDTREHEEVINCDAATIWDVCNLLKTMEKNRVCPRTTLNSTLHPSY